MDRNGRMAMMRTIEPKVFVEFKRWMSGLPDREPIKRQRDAVQANAVQLLLDEGLLTDVTQEKRISPMKPPI